MNAALRPPNALSQFGNLTTSHYLTEKSLKIPISKLQTIKVQEWGHPTPVTHVAYPIFKLLFLAFTARPPFHYLSSHSSEKARIRSLLIIKGGSCLASSCCEVDVALCLWGKKHQWVKISMLPPPKACCMMQLLSIAAHWDDSDQCYLGCNLEARPVLRAKVLHYVTSATLQS